MSHNQILPLNVFYSCIHGMENHLCIYDMSGFVLQLMHWAISCNTILYTGILNLEIYYLVLHQMEGKKWNYIQKILRTRIIIYSFT